MSAPVVSVKCPQLPPPPIEAVDALAAAGAKEPNVAAWVIALDRHYDKLAVCGG